MDVWFKCQPMNEIKINSIKMANREQSEQTKYFPNSKSRPGPNPWYTIYPVVYYVSPTADPTNNLTGRNVTFKQTVGMTRLAKLIPATKSSALFLIPTNF